MLCANRIIAAFFLLAAACSNPPGPSDGGHDAMPVDVAADAPSTRDAVIADAARCTVDNDCADSIFCNGAERCMPGAAGADARGCVVASPATPCTAGQTCNEAGRTCSSSCADIDGDGHGALACGGDD